VQIIFLHYNFFETNQQQAWKEWVEQGKDGMKKIGELQKKV